MMNTEQLIECIGQDSCLKKYCLGVFAENELPKIDSYPSCCIMNLDPNYMPGSHWTCVFFDVDKCAVYFDSYGDRANSKTIRKFVLDHSHLVTYNDIMLQSMYSSVCGQYCLYFLHELSRGCGLWKILEKFSSDNVASNDEKVGEWAANHFIVKNNGYEINDKCQCSVPRCVK